MLTLEAATHCLLIFSMDIDTLYLTRSWQYTITCFLMEQTNFGGIQRPCVTKAQPLVLYYMVTDLFHHFREEFGDYGVSIGYDIWLYDVFLHKISTERASRSFTQMRVYGTQFVCPNDIFVSFSNIRSTLAGDWPPAILAHAVEKLQCPARGEDGVAIRVPGSFIIGNRLIICGDCVQVEGLPNFKDLSIDIPSK